MSLATKRPSSGDGPEDSSVNGHARKLVSLEGPSSFVRESNDHGGAPEVEQDVANVRLPVEQIAVPSPLDPPQPLPRADRLPVYDPFTTRRRRSPEWLVGYVGWLVFVDLLAVLAAVALVVSGPLAGPVPRLVVSAALVAAWPALLALSGTYAERRQGTGSEEYRRVLDAGIALMAALGFLSVGLSVPSLGRPLLMVPVATALTLSARALARRHLHRARRRGLMTKRLVAVGAVGGVVDLVRRVRRDSDLGLRVVGACVPRDADVDRLGALGVPICGDLDRVVRVLDEVRADAVLVVPGEDTTGPFLRDLAWRLEGTNIELLVGTGMIEVAPHRLTVRPTTTAPLIRVQEPEFRGFRRVVKALFDRVAALLLIMLTAPVTLAIAVVIRVTSPGPVLYRHRRIGKGGRAFDVLKFRSMAADAPPDVALLGLNEGNAVQFKVKTDPRATPVGRVLRRTSLDELPQLLNVLKGDMSLVGPRPHVTREVEMYGSDMHRRLLVKPGITGLWQVSGRSDLDWDAAVELDVRYVENWSLALDLTILWRTLRAVIRGSGAY